MHLETKFLYIEGLTCLAINSVLHYSVQFMRFYQAQIYIYRDEMF